MVDDNDPDRERLAQASRYIRQAVEEILQQSGVPPSTTSTAATARMPLPATPVKPAQFEGVVAQWCNPLTWKPEQSDRVGSRRGRASPLERHDKGSRTRLALSYFCDPSAWR